MNKYNEIPVYFCTKCRSLKILREGKKDICGECGSSHYISITNIYTFINTVKEDEKRT